MYSLTVLVLTISVLEAMTASSRERVGWVGFALFGWVYLALSLWPMFRMVTMPNRTILVTQYVLDLFALDPGGNATEYFLISHSVTALVMAGLGMLAGRALAARGIGRSEAACGRD
jgi:hypothetical protein